MILMMYAIGGLPAAKDTAVDWGNIGLCV